MKTVKIKDNSYLNSSLFANIPNIVNKVSDKTLGKLSEEGIFIFPEAFKDSEDISEDQFILQKINEQYKTSNVMGFLGYDNERLIIESRFSGGDNDYFFQYLLSRVLDIPNIIDMETSASHDTRTFNLLLFLFPYYLKKAMRKGIFKTYIKNQYNDINVKGTIDVKRHIEKNTPFLGNIAYNQREYSYDNYVTELIRHTIEFIKGKSYGKVVISRVKEEVRLLINATDSYNLCDRSKIIRQNIKKSIKHAYYKEYSVLQKLCILILQHQRHDFNISNGRVYGILFDGAWLWEEYISKVLGDKFYHPQNKLGKGNQWLFTDENGNKVGKIYPDFIGKSLSVIGDAKYKPADNIGNKDYLQLLAYMFRFNSKLGYYFYPQTNEDKNIVLRLNSGYDKNIEPIDDIKVIKYGLKIPNNIDSYDEFVKEIKASEKEFLAGITNSII